MTQSWDYIAKLVCIGDSGTGKSSLTIRLCEGRFSPYHDVTIGVEFGSRIVPVGPPHNLTLSQPPSSPSESSSPTPHRQPQSKSQKHMKLSLWDTAGQETYKSVTRSYFRGASGALLVFDITRRDTFTHVTDWLRDLRQIAEPDIVVVLVGNKADLAPEEPEEPEEPEDSKGPPDQESQEDGPHDNTSESNPPDRPPSQGAFGSGSGREAGGRARAVTPAEAQRWCTLNSVLTYVETSAKSGEGVERAFMQVAERIWENIEAGRYDLQDRRSGVKRNAANGSAGRSGGGSNRGGTVILGLNDAATSAGGGGGGTGWGRCC